MDLAAFLNCIHQCKYFVVNNKIESEFLLIMNSDCTKIYIEENIIDMLNFLIDNIFAISGGQVFQQAVGIPME